MYNMASEIFNEILRKLLIPIIVIFLMGVFIGYLIFN